MPALCLQRMPSKTKRVKCLSPSWSQGARLDPCFLHASKVIYRRISRWLINEDLFAWKRTASCKDVPVVLKYLRGDDEVVMVSNGREMLPACCSLALCWGRGCRAGSYSPGSGRSGALVLRCHTGRAPRCAPCCSVPAAHWCMAGYFLMGRGLAVMKALIARFSARPWPLFGTESVGSTDRCLPSHRLLSFLFPHYCFCDLCHMSFQFSETVLAQTYFLSSNDRYFFRQCW